MRRSSRRAIAKADINQFPVGTGPFLLRTYQKDALIRYDANPDYWKPDDVKLARLVFAITPDPAARLQKLVAGECQVSAFRGRPISIRSGATRS